MTPSDIYVRLAEKYTQIYLYQNAMRELGDKDLADLKKIEELAKDNPALIEGPVSANSMFFRSLIDGEHNRFGQRAMMLKERYLQVALHRNKQYMWLFAEAYEEFEIFLRSTYACIGRHDNTFWPLRDYGSATINELDKKPFDWFEIRAKRKKDSPSSILNIFRTKITEIKDIESNNALEINLRLALTLAEQLRHVIVHNGDKVRNKSKFVELILKNSGLFNNGKYDSDNADLINQFFGSGDYENYIMLLEIPKETEFPIPMYINMFEIMTNFMISYSHFLTGALEKRYDFKTISAK